MMNVSTGGKNRRLWGTWGALDWHPSEHGLVRLLDALTVQLALTNAAELERTAPSVRPMSDLRDESDQRTRDELAEARGELDSFRVALEDARTRGGTDPSVEVAYRSDDVEDDLSADVLIQYLVRPGFAEVRTEQGPDQQYIYWININWPKLRALADEIGHPLILV